MVQDLNKETVVLLDDFSAELDDLAQGRLLATLASLNSQVFMTTLTSAAVDHMQHSLNFSTVAVYEVSEGRVQPQIFSN
jgi:DNA replication and repair protein RecF